MSLGKVTLLPGWDASHGIAGLPPGYPFIHLSGETMWGKLQPRAGQN